MSLVVKRSVSIRGHRTSFSLEQPFFDDLAQIAAHRGMPLAALVERYAACATAARDSIDLADDAGDADTADIFTAYSRPLDKALWFLKSHLE